MSESSAEILIPMRDDEPNPGIAKLRAMPRDTQLSRLQLAELMGCEKDTMVKRFRKLNIPFSIDNPTRTRLYRVADLLEYADIIAGRTTQFRLPVKGESLAREIDTELEEDGEGTPDPDDPEDVDAHPIQERLDNLAKAVEALQASLGGQTFERLESLATTLAAMQASLAEGQREVVTLTARASKAEAELSALRKHSGEQVEAEREKARLLVEKETARYEAEKRRADEATERASRAEREVERMRNLAEAEFARLREDVADSKRSWWARTLLPRKR